MQLFSDEWDGGVAARSQRGARPATADGGADFSGVSDCRYYPHSGIHPLSPGHHQRRRWVRTSAVPGGRRFCIRKLPAARKIVLIPSAGVPCGSGVLFALPSPPNVSIAGFELGAPRGLQPLAIDHHVFVSTEHCVSTNLATLLISS